jgi:hypothetical protein
MRRDFEEPFQWFRCQSKSKSVISYEVLNPNSSLSLAPRGQKRCWRLSRLPDERRGLMCRCEKRGPQARAKMGNVQMRSSDPGNERAAKGKGSKFGLTEEESLTKKGHEETKSHGKGGDSVFPRCLQRGHFAKGCAREPKAEWHACCQYWGKHRWGCRQQRKGNPGRLVKAVEER